MIVHDRPASSRQPAVRPRERMNSPQQPRKAPQTARGFNREHCGNAPHAPMPPHPSAQADIAFSQPRIHSPLDAWAAASSRSRLASSRAGEPAAGTAGSPANRAGLRGRRYRAVTHAPARKSVIPRGFALASSRAGEPAAGTAGSPANCAGLCGRWHRAVTHAPPRKSVIPRERRAGLSGSQSPVRDRGIYSLLLVTRRRAGISRPQSAQADFAPFQRRIHSLQDRAGLRGLRYHAVTHAPPRKSVIPRERRAGLSGSQSPVRDRGIYSLLLVTRRRAGISRPQSAQADFARFPRRIHSLQDGYAPASLGSHPDGGPCR